MTAITAIRRRLGATAWWLAAGLVAGTTIIIVHTVDGAALRRVTASVVDHPVALLVVVAVYGAAFVLRAVAWCRALPGLSPHHAIAALHVSLGANHLLPLRLGEVLRVTSVTRRAGIAAPAALASTVAMRAADLLSICVLALVLGPGLAVDVLGAWGPLLLALAMLAVVIAGRWSSRRRRRHDDVHAAGPIALLLVIASWMLEAVVVHQAAAWAGAPITVAHAVLVTAIAVAAQVVAVAPAGVGTYEAAATGALVAVGIAPATGLAIAVTAHAIKTAYALLAGAVAAVVPSPSLVGRLQLAPRRPAATTASRPAAAADAPIVLFLPAHDEEATVADVVGRTPDLIAGHPVRCLVIDDGSTDRTAERARAAGAEVIASARNRGLGAAVRRGLDEAVARGAVAVAFCDADGEYAPEELPSLVAPILDGAADYVVGSRFAGTIGRMLPHRRLGNRVLTLALRFVTRTPITDGQSGYRALSRLAAQQARIVHDFNYAQVLTIDLLARDARYAEVPVSYRFRETGRSFVRLGRYLAAVIPAIHHQLNTDVVSLWQAEGHPPHPATRSAR
ncbi:MAG TPA: glycosyltransferase [Euzebyales bacterium]|nr:glycosyltransferase [Euzebyales bacterium]